MLTEDFEYLNPGFFELSSRLKKGFLDPFSSKALSLYFRPLSEVHAKFIFPYLLLNTSKLPAQSLF
jgi:hypothetical protein